MPILDEFFTNSLEYDFFKLFCSEKLGEGQGREVWSFCYDENFVIKFEPYAQSFQNVSEWNFWQDVLLADDPEITKWFAPCNQISACGRVLIQKRTKPLEASKYPLKIPAHFTDLKLNNFGMLGKQFVCHDYGTHNMMQYGLTKRLKKVKWHDVS